MKSLKEALLNRPENIDVAEMVAEEYIKANYTVEGKLTFETVNGVCIVNCDGDVGVKNIKIEKLTDGFVWGEVKGHFYCTHCEKLETLEGAPKYVGGHFYCQYCKNLKSLKGAPKEVGRDFYCTGCTKLESLEGAPEEVGEYFYCYGCRKLKSLKGAPKKVKGIGCDKRLK